MTKKPKQSREHLMQEIKAVEQRICSLETAISKAQAYLVDGSHSHWHGFRPLYVDKVIDGQVQPPHNDWVKSTFIPNKIKSLGQAEMALQRLQEKLKLC
jgi:predicted metal-dependent phosphotriesterase family hydrolase